MTETFVEYVTGILESRTHPAQYATASLAQGYLDRIRHANGGIPPELTELNSQLDRFWKSLEQIPESRY